MINFSTLFFIIIYVLLFMCCSDRKVASTQSAISSPWWASITPIVIDGDEFYGKPCSVTQVIANNDGSESETVIFNVPPRILTTCKQAEKGRNYLEYDGKYIILHVVRQTFGAGSTTGERYRSADFKSWEEYIGVTWINSEEYEAWRKVDSTYSIADSRSKVVSE